MNVLQDQVNNIQQNSFYNNSMNGSPHKSNISHHEHINTFDEMPLPALLNKEMVSIDDMPIPITGKPKTFEEILESQLRQQENVMDPSSTSHREQKPPKREFLKRKS